MPPKHHCSCNRRNQKAETPSCPDWLNLVFHLMQIWAQSSSHHHLKKTLLTAPLTSVPQLNRGGKQRKEQTHPGTVISTDGDPLVLWEVVWDGGTGGGRGHERSGCGSCPVHANRDLHRLRTNHLQTLLPARQRKTHVFNASSLNIAKHVGADYRHLLPARQTANL